MREIAALRQELRATDRDRYLASLLMPDEAQRDVIAIYLFNAEIAAVRDRIREPMAGEIRLQWWREVVDGGRAGEAQAHPLAPALLDAIGRHSLPRAAFTRMLEAREFDLYDDPMPDRAAYEAYAGQTASTLIQLSATLLDPDNAAAYSEAAGHAGVAHSVAGHLMLLPLHRQRGQIYLPGDLLSATGLDRESFLAGTDDARLKAAISAFVGFGRDHLENARAALARTPESGRAAFAAAAVSEAVFRRAARIGGRCLVQAPQPPLILRQWRIWRAARRGMI